MNTKFIQGEPCWIDVSATDVHEAARFYKQLFGWQTSNVGTAEHPYIAFTQSGKPIGAVGEVHEDDDPRWTPYFKVSDIHGMPEAVQDEGGYVMVLTQQLPGNRSVALFSAPDGARFGVMEGRSDNTMQLWRVEGAVHSFTLMAKNSNIFAFYNRLFGWRLMRGIAGAMLRNPNSSTAFGHMHVVDHATRGFASEWITNFMVSDVADSARLATKLGGEVITGPVVLPGGIRVATINDPQGARFSVMKVG